MVNALNMMIVGNLFLFFILLVLIVVWVLKPDAPHPQKNKKTKEDLKKIKDQIEKE